jgi:hypothetical protein
MIFRPVGVVQLEKIFSRGFAIVGTEKLIKKNET